MVNNQQAGKMLLLLGVAFCVLQIWLPQFFLTGDGPCHIYNAQVLHDLWHRENTEFYKRFYRIVDKPNPNWLSTAAMAVLLSVIKGAVVEKIFLTGYALIFVSGFYLLIRRISNNHPYWPLIVLIFVFTQALSKGFYNFSFSIGFYFWMVWAWLRYLDKRNVRNAVVFFLFVPLAFFTHLLAFVFAAFTCGALVFSYAIATVPGSMKDKMVKYFVKYTGLLLLLLLPCLLLMWWFMEKEGGLQMELRHHFSRLIDLVTFRYIVNVTNGEDMVAVVAGLTLLLLFALSLGRFRRGIIIDKYDGFLASLLFMSFVYLFFPEDFMGRGIIISMRVQLYVFIAIGCCIAYMLPSQRLKSVGGIVLFICFITFSIIRIPCRERVAAGVAEYQAIIPFIKPYAVVLPFDFSPDGLDEQGKMLADRNWLFSHASEYIGLAKPMILLDNYEAEMGYFPLSWTDGVNPYIHLSRGGSIESAPPIVHVAMYREKAGVTIDNIVMWCYNDSFLNNQKFAAVYADINAEYKVIYTSPTKRVILYGKKDR